MAETFEFWGIVEVMGHAKFAGFITEENGFIRVDVPEITADVPSFTKYLGKGSIFGITPMSEEAARAAAQRWRSRPIAEYQLPTRPAGLEGPFDDDDDF